MELRKKKTLVEDLTTKLAETATYLKKVDDKIREYQKALNNLGKDKIALTSKYNTLNELRESYTPKDKK